jgi:hypothetical protein
MARVSLLVGGALADRLATTVQNIRTNGRPTAQSRLKAGDGLNQIFTRKLKTRR